MAPSYEDLFARGEEALDRQDAQLERERERAQREAERIVSERRAREEQRRLAEKEAKEGWQRAIANKFDADIKTMLAAYRDVHFPNKGYGIGGPAYDFDSGIITRARWWFEGKEILTNYYEGEDWTAHYRVTISISFRIGLWGAVKHAFFEIGENDVDRVKICDDGKDSLARLASVLARTRANCRAYPPERPYEDDGWIR